MTFLLAGVAVRMVWRSLQRPAAGKWLQLAASILLAGFVYLYGAWVLGSVYLRYAFVIGWIGVALTASFKEKPETSGRTARKWPLLLLCAMAGALDLLYFTGTAGQAGYADLHFPLKGSRYLILQGGKGLPANIFHFNNHRAIYAMDLVKLDQWGRRCSQVFSRKNEDYFIYGDTIYAPCSGIVQRAIDDNPDNIPPLRMRGPHNLNGVVIAGDHFTVFLGHMQQYRVFVKTGERVQTGQAIGLAGNSGMSIEPHLHIQAHQPSRDGRPWYQQPQLFMRFEGSEYLLNDIIHPRKKL